MTSPVTKDPTARRDAVPRGRFVWHELMTTDPDAARRFYRDVIGWTTEQFPGGAQRYDMWVNEGTPIGGVMELPEEVRQQHVPPHWMGHVAVPDVDATVQQATGMGATVLVPPTDIPTVGRFSVLADPQGAVFSVFTSLGETPGHEPPPRRGEVSWHELLTTDQSAALDFYQRLFGWEQLEGHDMGPMGIYQLVGRNGQAFGGVFTRPAEMPAPPHWGLYFMVDDIDRAVERVTAAGGTVMNGPMEVPGGDRVAQCMDPQGASFGLHEKAAT